MGVGYVSWLFRVTPPDVHSEFTLIHWSFKTAARTCRRPCSSTHASRWSEGSGHKPYPPLPPAWFPTLSATGVTAQPNAKG